MWHASLICVTCFVHMCDMMHSHVWHDSFLCLTCLIHMCDRGMIGVSIRRGEGKFVLLKLAFESTLEGHVCNVLLVPVKTGWLSGASLYSIFPVNRHLLYQAVGAASSHGKCVELDIKISRYLEMQPRYLDLSWCGPRGLVQKGRIYWKYRIQTCLS